ncbi:hypothetical protein M2092_000329 [Fusobacterium sp. PH5-44]
MIEVIKQFMSKYESEQNRSFDRFILIFVTIKSTALLVVYMFMYKQLISVETTSLISRIINMSKIIVYILYCGKDKWYKNRFFFIWLFLNIIYHSVESTLQNRVSIEWIVNNYLFFSVVFVSVKAIFTAFSYQFFKFLSYKQYFKTYKNYIDNQ